jgi:pimeloyl-ACP methyl ester carboxylesterase
MRWAIAAVTAALIAAAPAQGAERVVNRAGFDEPGTPRQFDRVGVVEVGPRSAKNVLVVEPGTSAGAGMIVPVAQDIVKALDDWQVWIVERRENALEDHTLLDSAPSARGVFDYYLGWIGQQPEPARHYAPRADAETEFARNWGMRVAVEDLRVVIRAARRGGHRVVLGGHSLGATIATAYAAWDFDGRPGARDLDGLVLIDGGSSSAISAKEAGKQLKALAAGSPFLDLAGTGVPWSAGVFAAVGATAAELDPDGGSLLQAWPLLPAALKPSGPATNKAALGFTLDTRTGPESLRLVQAHIGRLTETGGWENDGNATVERAARALRGIKSIDGTAWFHPRRLSLDGGAVNGGVANPAQKKLGVRATHKVKLPIYAFETSLGKGRVLKAARALAKRGGGPKPVLVDRSATDAHCDPLFDVPERNAFLKTVTKFLRG